MSNIKTVKSLLNALDRYYSKTIVKKLEFEDRERYHYTFIIALKSEVSYLIDEVEELRTVVQYLRKSDLGVK